jgi:hypothetical protein
VDQLLEEPDCKDYSQLTDIFFFVDLIKANYSNNAGARELVKTLPEISGFFQQDTLVEFIQLTFAIYKEKKDTTFRNEAVYSIGRIIPLLNNKYEDMLTMMKELLLYAVDYTEIASIIKAFTSIIQVLPQITIITKSTILYAIIPMVGHPCSLVHNNVLKFIKLLFSQASYEEIYLVISPILTEFARLQDKKDKNMSDQIPILDFDTFLLAKNEPLSYSKYRTLQDAVTRSTDSVKMSSIETYIFNYLTNISNKGSKKTFSADKNSISLKKREFKMKRNIHSFIHEVLGSLALYQNFQSKENEFDKFKESLKEPLKLANGKTADDVKNGTVLLQKIISEALNSIENSGYSFYPVWTNKPESYKRILEFKEQYIDVIGVVRDEYKFLKHFNFNVLKLCMNYIQMIIHQTKLNEVVEGPRAMKSLDDDYLNRLKRWKPTGTLLTSINSHEGVVKSLAQINGNVFVSGGHDGHLKYHSLPTLMRNFIHSQVLDIDLNRVIDPESTDPISQKKPLKINQVHYMKNINKLAVVTNSEYLIINQEGKPDVNYKFKCNSRITAATIYGQDEYSNCVACVNTGCEFVLWDLRKKTPALVCNLSKLRGVPSSICRVDGKK